MNTAASLSFSFHAMKRCVERGISAQNVMDTVTRGTRIANSGEKVVFARGRMRVVVTHEAMVVTAYRERRNNPKRQEGAAEAGYGDAINAKAATEFIAAAMEALND